MYVDAAPVSTVIDNADSPRHIDRNGTLCYNHLAIAGSPYTAHTTVEMAEDPTYNPGQTWWEKLWGTIGSWWRSIPKWQKVLVGAIFIAVSIGIAVATCGASVGPEAQLLGGAAAATALATAAKVALIEVSIGIGFAVAGWAINAADTGDWSINSLENSIADSIFFTGVFLFISTSVSANKYMYRADPYPTPEVIRTELSNAELKVFGERGHNQGFRQVIGTHDDAMKFFRSQTISYKMIEPGKYLGVNSRNVMFVIYDQPVTRLGAYTSIRIYGVKGLSGIKFMWP